MARNISAAAQAKLDQNFGTEPALIIEIQWVDGGSIYRYSDKDIDGTEGKILEVSGLDNTVVVQSVQSGTSSDSQQISIVLDDTDGSIKNLIDQHDVHKEPAWVYQWFQGTSTDDKFLIFKGQISSPFQWDEGARTVSLDIITRIEDAEVGFSIEEGNFELVSEELVGKPWPLVFGTVKDVPALRTRTPRKGLLRTGFGIVDYVLQPKKEQAGNICCSWVFQGFNTYYEAGFGGSYRLVIDPVYERDINCTCRKQAVQCEMELNYQEQVQHVKSTLAIVDGDKFPQGEQITLNINGAEISGKFNGTPENPVAIFSITNQVHPKQIAGDPEVPPIKYWLCTSAPTTATPGDANSGDQSSIGTKTCILPSDCAGWKNSPYFPPAVGDQITLATMVEDTGESLEQQGWDYLAQFNEAGFFWAEPGSEVTLAGDQEILYVANLLPSTVHTVKAWRTFSVSNLRQLTTVPNTYYTVRQSDFGVYTTTEIVFDRPLSTRGEGWEDDIYVTMTSSVGPNPVDEMEWLINKYTPYTFDATFADVKAKVDNYPMNFMVPGRPNVFDLLKDMAFQGRMALVLRNDVFILKYLPEEPLEDGNITENDVLANSLVLDHTSTEDLRTKLVCQWKPRLSIDDPYKVILRYNGDRYGMHEETIDFFCYNVQELVTKSGTFWLLRMANTWRKIICKTPINKLALETLDGVFVTLPDIADGEIKCRVETATYNSNDNSIDFIIQTPVRSGERTPYSFAYPANISVDEVRPTEDDFLFNRTGGGGPGVDVEPPEGHVLGSGDPNLVQNINWEDKGVCESLNIDLYNQCRPDVGDTRPSDTDDVKPEIDVDEDNSIIPPSQSSVNEISVTEQQFKEAQLLNEGQLGQLQGQVTNNLNTGTGNNNGAGANGGAGAGAPGSENPAFDALKELPSVQDLIDQGKCVYGLRVFYYNPVEAVLIGPGETCGGGGTPCGNANGCPCGEEGLSGCVATNQVLTVTEEFAFDTKAARNAMKDTFEAIKSGDATVGSIHPGIVLAFDVASSGCDEGDAAGNIIGFTSSGEFGEDGSEITGVGEFGGFMNEDDWEPPPECEI
jgi:hypothetical protein